MSKLSQLWNCALRTHCRGNWAIALPLLLFIVILIHGGLLGLGLTDDEAYYWVLAQKPALGYAYHPPAVAWWIAVSQYILSPLIGSHHELIVRFPSALTSALLLGLSLNWLGCAGVPRDRILRSGLILLSVAGLFALSWMMVPDIPMFLGWTLAFSATWKICFTEPETKLRRYYLFLFIGILIAVLSKYSAILGALSALIAIGVWAPARRRNLGWGVVVMGCALAAVPIVIWNAQHEWVSILYQIQERHQGGALSLIRYLRFWIIELLIAGPILVGFAFPLIKLAGNNRTAQYLLTWILPGAAVFLIQPLWSDFKPHWALIVWWPLALAFAWALGVAPDNRGLVRRARLQIGYGIGLGALVLLCCHIPIGGAVLKMIKPEADPRLDVTNDLYGWNELRGFVFEKLGPEALKLPVIGSRYQTASQAAFAIGQGGVGVLLPRGIRDKDEWPSVEVVDSIGPQWPVLKSAVLFVADNRYDVAPAFPHARCDQIGKIEKFRWQYLAKWITVWRCEPDGALPEPKVESDRQSL